MSNRLSQLQQQILNCKDCMKFGIEPNPIVFGKSNAKIVHISQAPSQNVHKTTKPFNDQSGKKLRQVWYQIQDEDFYNQDNFYITAIAHCFPGKAKNGGDKKAPKYCANKWLQKELKLINNKIYLIIGKQACEYLFPNEDYNRLIFKNSLLNGKPAFVLPHPSPANSRWFKPHPEFEKERIAYIRGIIHKVIY